MSRAVTLLGYAVLALVAAILEVAARRRQSQSPSASPSPSPTFGDSLRLLLPRPPLRTLALAAWLWLGWHLFVRVDWQ